MLSLDFASVRPRCGLILFSSIDFLPWVWEMEAPLLALAQTLQWAWTWSCVHPRVDLCGHENDYADWPA